MPQEDNAIALLKADHRKVEGLFAEYKNADESRQGELVHEICTELIIHTTIEEKVFYPACRAAAADEGPLDEAQVEHDSAKLLIADLIRGGRDDPYRDAKVAVLAEQIKHHVGEEEQPRTGIMARAEAAGVNTPQLAQRVQEAKQHLESRAGRLPSPRPVSLNTANFFRDDPMSRRDDRLGRDERGRFRDEDERGRGGWEERGEGPRHGASRDDDDRRYGRPHPDDDRRPGEPGGGRDHGGWFSDPEGHSEASRRGWERRR